MEQEFDGGIPNARVMIKDVSIPEALEYKERMEAVLGVTGVTWFDDATDIFVPISNIDSEILETYYKDNTALFTVTIEEESRISAVAEIREITGGDNAMSGSAVSTRIFNEQTQLGRDIASIEEVFGQRDTYVLMVPRGDTATETELSNEQHELSEITSIISYVDMAGAELPLEYLDEDTLSQLMSKNYSRMVLSVDAAYEGEDTFSLVETIRNITECYYRITG